MLNFASGVRVLLRTAVLIKANSKPVYWQKEKQLTLLRMGCSGPSCVLEWLSQPPKNDCKLHPPTPHFYVIYYVWLYMQCGIVLPSFSTVIS